MIAGRYALGRELGRGGMGAVWLGTDEVLGRPVALKRLAPAHSPSRARAEREARLAARLSHPHVVAVYDLVTEAEDQWLVMEYVEGSTLAAHVTAEGPLSPDAAAPLLRQIADALAAAHAAGIVHRDVKPSNILLDAVGEAKLTDFGIARSDDLDATLTQTGFLTGSPAYLAPEVAAGAPAGPASDVWSLGATAFHALTGRPPYEVGENVMGTLYRIVHEQPPRTEAAGWLAPLVEGTMTQDPARRWSLAQVQEFLAGRRVPAAATRTLPTLAAVAPTTPPPGPPPGAAPPGSPAPVPPTPAAPAAAATARLAGAPTRARVAHARARAVPGRRHPGAPRRPSRLWASIAGGAVAIALLVALVAVHPWSRSGPTASPRTGPSPSSDPSTSASVAPAGPTADGVRAFVSTYLATASSDPAKGFAMLTPAYQRASGGLKGYERFWGNVRKVQSVGEVVPSLDPLGVSYRYTYVLRGAGKRTEDVHLRLAYTDGQYLISAG
ncbi:serine/threonine-protein kinase [Nocardioides sp. BP30]|uniref:serine/threonine-protein kinase n=1 Tax=Nocardioides sp. BP30 TaxID=3036374 RepID=UPI002468607C|nr:serine/threonine-protein kinase [Nocardioides sp. BP30]WGL51090.1 serine/threonine-protein kinase [Nocardioides sp. BP30]